MLEDTDESASEEVREDLTILGLWYWGLGALYARSVGRWGYGELKNRDQESSNVKRIDNGSIAVVGVAAMG